MFRILLLSAGSLLGQNVLDSIKNRRNKIKITGLDSDPESPRIYRCDKVYISPLTEAKKFENFVLNIINIEKPQLVLPGGDRDVLFLSKLIDKHPVLARIIPLGNSKAAEIINDKALSYKFSIEHNLPFAKTLILDNCNINDAINWAKKVKYPLIAKPKKGYGSLGVKFVINEDQLIELVKQYSESYLLQELLDYSNEKKEYIEQIQIQIKSGIPLFTYFPDYFEYTAQTCILPDGSHSEIFTSLTSMIVGKCEKSEYFVDNEFLNVAKKFATAISKIGWRGMFNLQCKKTINGYIAYEMNGRMSGSSSARELMGYDEIGLLSKYYSGYDISSNAAYERTSGYIARSLTDYYIKYNDVKKLKTNLIWEIQPISD